MTPEEKHAVVENLAHPTRQLLRYLGQLDVVGIIRQHYARYGNTAPPAVAEMMIADVQNALKEHTQEGV